MPGSAGAQKIRDAFVANGCKTKNGIAYETGEAFRDTFLHPLSPAAQVGGFAGASATRVASDSKEGNDMLRIRIENEAGLRSFFYHLVRIAPLAGGRGERSIKRLSGRSPFLPHAKTHTSSGNRWSCSSGHSCPRGCRARSGSSFCMVLTPF